MTVDDNAKAREALLEIFAAWNLAPGADIHSWRCYHPDRYGPCTCAEDLANDILEKGWVPPEQHEAVIEDYDRILQRLSSILNQVAVALKGPEPPLTSWGYHDLPELAATAAGNPIPTQGEEQL